MKRRGFLKLMAASGIGTSAVGYFDLAKSLIPGTNKGIKAPHSVYGLADEPEWLLDKTTGKYRKNPKFIIRHTVDLQCHSECGLRVKIDKNSGKIARIIGNPYQANTLDQFLPYDRPLLETANTPGTVCARGNSGMQTAYDPYRLTQPLKRVGERGSNRWKPIPWEQFIEEVVEGGKIFADTEDKKSRPLKVKGFRAVHDQKNTLIDPEQPELGYASNRLVMQSGRIKSSRRAFQQRFAQAFGTINEYEHTNVCEVSHHVATEMVYPHKHAVKPDLRETEFAIFWGTSPGDANFPMQTVGKYVAEARTKGARHVYIDPICHRGNILGDSAEWIPINPGSDGAMAMGMIRWIIENKRYNENYLSNPTQQAAENAGELSHTDASYLVIVDEEHAQVGAYLTSKAAGLGDSKEKIAIDQGTQNPGSAESLVKAIVDFDGFVNGIRVKSAFRLLKESAFSHSIADYAQTAGVDEQKIIDLAKEFTAHGRKASAEFYRGIVKHPNGYYNGTAVHMLNVLIGNLNWSGGITAGGGSFNWKTGHYKVTQVPGLKHKPKGVKITREGSHYEISSEFKRKLAETGSGYPAKRPWFPHTFNVYSEILPSITQGYPYHADILIWHMATPFYSVPGQHNEELLTKVKDPTVIPLIIASDIVIGDTSMYADYVLPDVTFLERWVHIGLHEATLSKGCSVRWPVIEPLTGKTRDGRHFSFETFLIDVAEKLELKGFGKRGIEDANGKLWPLHQAEDYYLKATANVAYDQVPVEPVSAEDMAVCELDDFHQRYKNTLAVEEWPRVLKVLSRGGRFEPHENIRNGKKLGHLYSRQLHLYAEEVALSHNAISGKAFSGVPGWIAPTTITGTPLTQLDKQQDWPLTLLTYKGALQTHSRLCSNTVLREIQPENWIEVNEDDANKKGIQDGQLIWVETVHGKRKGRAKTRQGVAPGVITFSVGYGHWGYGANHLDIDGKKIAADKQRSAGIHLNPIMRRDPDIWQMPLMDPVGGSVVFYETRAKIYLA